MLYLSQSSSISARRLSHKQAAWFVVAFVAVLHVLVYWQLVEPGIEAGVCFGLTGIWAVWSALSRNHLLVRAFVCIAAYGTLGLTTSAAHSTPAYAIRFFDGVCEWGSLALPSIATLLIASRLGFRLRGPGACPVPISYRLNRPALQFSLLSLCALILAAAVALGIGTIFRRAVLAAPGFNRMNYVAPVFAIALPIQTVIMVWSVFGLTPLITRCIGSLAALVATWLWTEWIFDWPNVWEIWLVQAPLLIAALWPFRLAGYCVCRLPLRARKEKDS